MYQQILVPLDGSRLAEAILPHAIDLADRFSATVVLLCVTGGLAHAEEEVTPIAPPNLSPITYQPAVEVEEAVDREEDHKARRYLATVEERLNSAGIARRSLVLPGDPAACIRQAVTDEKIDLVVMATHARSRLGRLFHGSVAESVVHQVGVPVLLLRAHD
jgi:nucleotide-binding universal stress UspA family protein